MLKSTYGTGCFALLNTGTDLVRSKNRLLTTIAYRLDGETTYALEGAIFIAGASVQWMRDMLGLFEKSSDAGDAGGEGRSDAERLPGPGLRRAGGALVGRRGARLDHRPDAQFRRGRAGAGGARIGQLPDARPDRRDAQGLEGRQRHGAARRRRHGRRRTGRCSSSPTSSTRRSTGRPSSRPRRSGRPGSPATRRACGPTARASPSAGRWTASSGRKWTRRRGRGSSGAGATRCGGRWRSSRVYAHSTPRTGRRR